MPAVPKGKPQAALRAEQKAARVAVDQAESRKVKQRSQGRCEMQFTEAWEGLGVARIRCFRRAIQRKRRKTILEKKRAKEK